MFLFAVAFIMFSNLFHFLFKLGLFSISEFSKFSSTSSFCSISFLYSSHFSSVISLYKYIALFLFFVLYCLISFRGYQSIIIILWSLFVILFALSNMGFD